MASTLPFTFLLLSVGGSFVGGFPLPAGILVFTASTYSFFVISWRSMVQWLKTAKVYSMIFKVPACREEMGDPLDMYSVNHDIAPNYPVLERVERR